MTSEETKNYIDQRLHELGLALHLDDGGYEKIHRFTNGTESGINQLCFKLVSLTSENDEREVTTERVSKAIDELARIDDMMKRAGRTEVRQASDELEQSSIEQLAAVLEANAAVASAAAEVHAPVKVVGRGNGRASAKRAASERRPKILVVNESKTTRALIVNALTPEFECIDTADADDAWRRLAHQTDIELVITDVRGHERSQYDLIGRVRSAAAPAHLIGIPIIAMSMTEDANAKQRALVAGANDVIAMSTSAGELKARVTARYKASRVTPQYGAPMNRTASADRVPERKPSTAPAAAKAQPRTPNAPAAPAFNPASIEGVRRPFLNTVDVARRGPPVPNRFLAWLYQISATTTVTLSATVLVVVLLAVIMYVNRMEDPAPSARQSPPPPTAAVATPPPGIDSSASQPSVSEPPVSERAAPPATSPGDAERAADSAKTKTKGDPRAEPKSESGRGPEQTTGVTVPARPERWESSQPPAPDATAKSEVRPAPALPVPAPRPAAPENAPIAGAPSSATAADERVAREADVAGAARPVNERLSRDDLATLLKRFAFVYEAGDIEQFMNLFSANARTNDRVNRDGIRQDYETLFRSTDLRQFKLSHINWEVDNNQAHGWGNFEVTVRRAGDQELHNYSGSLTLYVERIDGRPRIVRLYHGQRRAGS